MLFDYKKLKAHRDFAADNIHKSDFLIDHVENIIRSNIVQLGWDPVKQKDILEIGPRSSELSSMFMDVGTNLTATDFSQKMLDKSPAKNKILIENDELPFEENSADLIISALNMHYVNDVREYVKTIQKILKPGGAFISTLIGDNSFSKLKKIIIDHEAKSGMPHMPHIIPFIAADKLYLLFQEAGFKFIIVNREEVKLEYRRPIDLMHDLKNMGENNACIDAPHILPRSIVQSQESFEDEIILVTLVVKKH